MDDVCWGHGGARGGPARRRHVAEPPDGGWSPWVCGTNHSVDRLTPRSGGPATSPFGQQDARLRSYNAFQPARQHRVVQRDRHRDRGHSDTSDTGRWSISFPYRAWTNDYARGPVLHARTWGKVRSLRSLMLLSGDEHTLTVLWHFHQEGCNLWRLRLGRVQPTFQTSPILRWKK